MARSSIGLSLFYSFYRAGLQTNNPAKGRKSTPNILLPFRVTTDSRSLATMLEGMQDVLYTG